MRKPAKPTPEFKQAMKPFAEMCIMMGLTAEQARKKLAEASIKRRAELKKHV